MEDECDDDQVWIRKSEKESWDIGTDIRRCDERYRRISDDGSVCGLWMV